MLILTRSLFGYTPLNLYQYRQAHIMSFLAFSTKNDAHTLNENGNEQTCELILADGSMVSFIKNA